MIKIIESGKHNRTLIVQNIPTKHEDDLNEIEVTLNYTQDGNPALSKAIALDSHVTPEIVRAVNCHEELVAALDNILNEASRNDAGIWLDLEAFQDHVATIALAALAKAKGEKQG